MKLRYLTTAFLYIGAISMFVMSLHYFQYELTGILKNKDIASNSIYRICLWIHIGLGITAIFLGPTQFIESFRNKYRNIHKTVGYCYFTSVLFSTITGLIVAQYAMGGLITRVGFSVLAIFWLISAILAVKFARNKKFIKHKKWMYISYGLTFAAITQRTLLLVPVIFDVEFIPIYRLSSWLPWMLNTVIAIYLFKKSEMKMGFKKEKIISSLLIFSLLTLSCKQGKAEENISENFNELTNNSVLIETGIQQRVYTLDWDEIPISHSNLGEFPYFNPPIGFEFDEPKTLDYSKLIYYVKNQMHSFEGKTFTTRFASSRDENLSRPEWNRVLFDKSYDGFIKSKGGILIFKGKIPKDSLSEIGTSGVSQYIVGDVYNQPTRIYAIHQPKNRVLVQLTSSTAGAAMGITSIVDFEQTITIINSETIKKELDNVGHIVLYINFETGKSRIMEDSYQIVSEIVGMLESYPDLKIVIEGHTDDIGDEAKNQQLSENRSKSVVLSLIDEGIDSSRLKSIGYGENKPILNNATESGRAKNRRVEIRKQ